MKYYTALLASFLLVVTPESIADTGATAELKVRYAISNQSRLPAGAYERLVRNNGLSRDDGFYPADDPPGPVPVDCNSVDYFGVTYQINGRALSRSGSRTVRVRFSHPDIDEEGFPFEQSRNIVRSSQARPQILTTGLDLRDEYKKNGLFTVVVTIAGIEQFSSEFLLINCNDAAAIN